jgi:hypothetical protein
MYDEESGGLLAAYAEALWETPDPGAGAWDRRSRSWPGDPGEWLRLARLVAWLEEVLVPVIPAEPFQVHLADQLQRGMSGRPAVPARWRKLAMAGSFLSVVGLAMLWRRRRMANGGAAMAGSPASKAATGKTSQPAL